MSEVKNMPLSLKNTLTFLFVIAISVFISVASAKFFARYGKEYVVHFAFRYLEIVENGRIFNDKVARLFGVFYGNAESVPNFFVRKPESFYDVFVGVINGDEIARILVFKLERRSRSGNFA